MPLFNPPDLDAIEVPIADAGAVYTGITVEAALQEIGAGTTLDGRYVTTAGDTMTGALQVLDATADGQPLAYDQAGARLNGATFTDQTIVSYAAPVLRLKDTGSTANTRSVRFQSSTNELLVIAENDAGVATSFPFKVGLSAPYPVTVQTEMRVPAATAANQAAQVTAIDSTTGRLAIGGIEIGDTGWRDVTASLINGWTATQALLRRNGNTVTFTFYGLNRTAKTADTFYTFPLGFRAEQVTSAVWPALDGATIEAGKVVFLFTAGIALNAVSGTASAYRGTYTWPTATAWPTTLPGTAA